MVPKYKRHLQALVLVFFVLAIPLVASADLGGGAPTSNLGGGGSPNNPGGVQTVTNPLGNNINSFCSLIKAILAAVIQIGIPVAVLFIVFAGFKFVLARGNSSKLDEAKKNLMYTLIGIGIFLGAWLLAMVISSTVNSLTAGSSSGPAISCQ